MLEMTKTTGSELANFGSRDPIRELAVRLRLMMPNAQKFTDPEAMAVAQVAWSHNLDPFNGEVWGIKGGGGEWYGVMVGIKGLRKGAKREADRENSIYWLDEPRLVEAKKYGVEKPGAIAYEITLRDTATTQAWSKSVHDLTTAGIPYKEAVEMLGGKSPSVIGVGIADPSERSKMSLHARAKKRAEAEALKIRYSLEFGGARVSIEDDLSEPVQTPANYGDADDFTRAIPGEIVEELPDPDVTFPKDAPAVSAPVVQEEPAKPSDTIETHKALWKQLNDAGKVNAETVKAWAVRNDAPAEIISEKCELMRKALGRTTEQINKELGF